MQREPLSDRTKGRWRGILSALGVDGRYLTGRNTSCPLCNAGRDRFRFSDRDGSGSWICSTCPDGHGDGAELVKRLKGIQFAEAAKLIEGVLGEARQEAPKPRLTPEAAKAAMGALWKRGKPLTPESFAGLYLASRGIIRPAYPTALRIADYTMLGQVISPDGKAVNIHRTFLTAAGTKAKREKVKMLMEGETPNGSAIRLGKPLGGILGIAEGVENALSVPGPCWATWSADSMAAFIAPEGVAKLTIWADNDANYHGQWAAMTCARANHRRGIEVEVRIPDKRGQDWNDVLVGITP